MLLQEILDKCTDAIDREIVHRWSRGEGLGSLCREFQRSRGRMASRLGLPPAGTLEYYIVRLSVLAPHLTVLSAERKGSRPVLYAKVKDSLNGKLYEKRLTDLIGQVKVRASTPSSRNFERYDEAYYQGKLDLIVPGRYKVLSRVGDPDALRFKLLDTIRAVEFTYKGDKAVQLLRKNPDRVFSPSPEEKSELQQRACVVGGVTKHPNKKEVRRRAKEIVEQTGRSEAYVMNVLSKDLEGGGQRLLQPRTRTAIESIVETWLDSWGVPYTWNHKLGSAGIPDFLIESRKLVIECDGLYWHSEYNADIKRSYHQKKRLAYKALGYRSLFFREDEILKSPLIVRSIIMNALGLCTQKIGARKTTIAEISSAFFTENHLMGKGTGTSYGLVTEEGNVVAAIQVCWFNKAAKILDISRFCTALETSVPGAYSRLLSHVIKQKTPNQIRTFVDLRYGEGEHLSIAGWRKETEYLSFKWTDGVSTFHRRLHLGNSGYEEGLTKIWDCGQARWALDVKQAALPVSKDAPEDQLVSPVLVPEVSSGDASASLVSKSTVLRMNKHLRNLGVASKYLVLSASVRLYGESKRVGWHLTVRDIPRDIEFSISSGSFLKTLRSNKDHVFTDKFGFKSPDLIIAKYQGVLDQMGLGLRYKVLSLLETRKSTSGSYHLLQFCDSVRKTTFSAPTSAVFTLLRRNHDHNFRNSQPLGTKS